MSEADFKEMDIAELLMLNANTLLEIERRVRETRSLLKQLSAKSIVFSKADLVRAIDSIGEQIETGKFEQ